MLTLYDEFAGVGGSSRGASRVPGVQVVFAANHWDKAVESHQVNFPDAGHHCGDVQTLDMDKVPRVDIFWASPACPPWTDARGKKRDFDKQTVQQGVLFGEQPVDPSIKRARALMEEVVRYLRSKARQSKPVLVGVVENVIQCRQWAEWDRWIREIEVLGYRTKVIAFNSMHARPRFSPRAPQSRDRLYVAYWHESLGRDPDWDKWLRPKAWCPSCGEVVDAMQTFKRPGNDMGRYRAQYVYRCPKMSCRFAAVEPEVLPALSAIDPTIPGVAIKDRPAGDELAPATVERIKAGVRRYWLPLFAPAGSWLSPSEPTQLVASGSTLSGLVPPLMVPVEGRPGKVASLATAPARTQTARNETALAAFPLPFLTPLRGGGDKERARPVTDPLTTVTASGNHHGLALPPLMMRNFTARGDQGQMVTPTAEPMRSVTASSRQAVLSWSSQLLVPYYGSSDTAIPAAGPVGALTARDRYGLASAVNVDFGVPSVDELIGDVRFRMLEPHEVGAAMAFDADYRVMAKSKRDKVRLYGNAVTPPVAEVIVSALVEAITGESMETAS